LVGVEQISAYEWLQKNKNKNPGAFKFASNKWENYFEPNGKWKFKAMVFEAEARKARLKGITGF